MASGTKRERDWEVSDIEEGKGISVHGIPIYVSPIRESSKTKGLHYFEARLSDGKKCARVVSFETSHRSAMKKAEENQEVVLLANSTAKKSSFSSETEVHMDKRSKVLESPRKISLGDIVPFKKAVKIADIVSLSAGQNFDVTCKVVKINDVEKVKKKKEDGKELRKQELVVGDETGSCRLVLWEEDVQSLEEGKSYRLGDVGVRKFGVNKYLSYLKTSTKESVDDLEEVNDDEVGWEETEHSGRVASGEISAVISVAEYHCCKLCRSKVEIQDVLATCTKCSAVMKVTCCCESKSAKFVVTQDTGHDTTLSAFEPVLSHIVEGVSGRDLTTKVLMTSPKVFRFNDRNIVFSVEGK